MDAREQISQQMTEQFQQVWQAGNAWDLETSPYERGKYDHLLGLLADRRYGRVIELGCGSGQFTGRLAGVAGRVLAIDIAPAAIERARAFGSGLDGVEFRTADVMRFDLQAEGPWDLVSFCETICCLGWLYSFFEIGWLASELFRTTAPGGRLLLANTYSEKRADWLLRPWLIRTYHDLFRHVGYRVQLEEVYRGVKNGTDQQALVTLFEKPTGAEPPRF